MTAYPDQTLNRTTLGQLCAAPWDSQSRPVVIQPGIEPGSVMTPLALQCRRPLRHSGASLVFVVDERSLSYCDVFNDTYILSHVVHVLTLSCVLRETVQIWLRHWLSMRNSWEGSHVLWTFPRRWFVCPLIWNCILLKKIYIYILSLSDTPVIYSQT